MKIQSNLKMNMEARESLLEGVNTIANAVKVTLGAAGRTVVIDHDMWPQPHITKDGVTVANSIFLNDPVKQTGVRLIKNVANNALNSTGDGTTTATVLAQAIVNEGMDSISDEVNVMKVVRGMNKAKDRILSLVDKNTTPIQYESKDLVNIATISANNDSVVGEAVAQAVNLAGENGMITVEQSDTVNTTIDLVDGVVVDSGFLSPYFVNNPNKRTVEFDNPYILVTNKVITNISEIEVLLRLVAAGKSSLVIIAKEVIGEALSTMILNAMKNAINVTALEAPGFGDYSKEYLSDIATAVGAEFITEESGLKLNEISLSDLGRADKVIINSEETNIIGAKGNKESIQSLIDVIKSNISNSTDDFNVEFNKKRLAKISGGVVIVKVGANSSVELQEKKDRFDDAVGASIAAVEQGVVVGGGLELYNIGKDFKLNLDDNDEQIGAEILLKSITAPALQILINSGMGIDEAQLELLSLKNGEVYDVITDKPVFAMEQGIIDPKMVVVSALEAAVSIGSTILTTEVAVVNETDDDEK